MTDLIKSLQSTLGESLPGVFGALIILFVGWIVALIIKAVLKKGLGMAQLNQRINSSDKDSKLDLEGGVALGGYYTVMLIALVAVFNQLGLEIAAQPIQALLTQVMEFIPKLIGGGILVLVAWLFGTIVKQVLSSALKASGADEKLGSAEKPFSQTIGQIAYWFIILVFLPGILAAFGIEGLLQPAQNMLDKIMAMLPNIIAAVIIGFAGWFVANILREIVSSLLAAAGTDKLGEKAGIKKLSVLAGTIVYFFTIVPAIIAALNALQIAAIAEPATAMLNSIMAMVPNILGATAILAITYFVAKPVSGIVGDLLKSVGANQLPQKMGLAKSDVTLSQYAGKGVFFFMMLFAAVEATNQLQFEQLSSIIAFFIQFGGKILFGAIIIAVGLWIANLVATAMNKTAPGGHTPISTLVRAVILGLVLAMGLREMGIADDIVNMAFGLTLGAAAVAFAISFGLGGREAAGKQMEFWFEGLRSGNGAKKTSTSAQNRLAQSS